MIYYLQKTPNNPIIIQLWFNIMEVDVEDTNIINEAKLMLNYTD